MVFPKLLITIVLASVLFFFIYESEGVSYSFGSHIGDHGVDTTSFDNQKVNLSVYYDSLSQSCAIFIVKDLQNILFFNDLISIVNLQLVPWASAYVDNAKKSIWCQNGPDECKLNSVESCAINLWHKVDMHYGLISCSEFHVIERRTQMWMDCINELNLPKESIVMCINRGKGTELGMKYINETGQLYPRPAIVPWVVVNNQPIGKDYANFTHYVCKAYKGVTVPKICNEV
ncbi:hypothetical protein VNO77_07425 [Canavalia gladiata]|uniref:Uncharacterized protein n=1 Tax=Canavalia gladiata TaxID=3824 RepID=A0AAN9R0L2_CANGL